MVKLISLTDGLVNEQVPFILIFQFGTLGGDIGVH
jgi:hypothetical protein